MMGWVLGCWVSGCWMVGCVVGSGAVCLGVGLVVGCCVGWMGWMLGGWVVFSF